VDDILTFLLRSCRQIPHARAEKLAQELEEISEKESASEEEYIRRIGVGMRAIVREYAKE
jgi:hypothetical protein